MDVAILRGYLGGEEGREVNGELREMVWLRVWLREWHSEWHPEWLWIAGILPPPFSCEGALTVIVLIVYCSVVCRSVS